MLLHEEDGVREVLLPKISLHYTDMNRSTMSNQKRAAELSTHLDLLHFPVLSLCRTKFDDSLKRVVGAVAIRIGVVLSASSENPPAQGVG